MMMITATMMIIMMTTTTLLMMIMMMMKVIIVIIILTIIALKGASQFFYAISSLRRELCPSSRGAILYKPRATHGAFITCNMSCATWYEGAAQQSNLDSIYFIFILLVEPYIDEGGEKTGVPGEIP